MEERLPTPEELYVEAERRIEEARRTGATQLRLDFWMELKPEKKDQWERHREKPVDFGLRQVPDSLVQLTQLQRLNLSNNQLTALPKALGKLTQLQRMFLSNNQLTALPESLGQLTKLQELYLSNNQLTALPEALGQLTQLKELNLGNNQLTVLPKALGQLRQLQTLDLKSNHLTALPAEVVQFARLQRLNLANNQLTALPAEVGQLAGLQYLFLDNNRLTALPAEVGQLAGLQELYLDGNPLPEELLEAYQEGIAELQAYLNLPKEPLREAKLVLVGEGAAGKSTLLDALLDEPWQDAREASRKETLGVSIKAVTLPSTRGAYDLQLNGWDFGGQERYLPTHQLFFSPRAVYLALWHPESRTNVQWQPVEQWIQLVRNRVPDAQVLVVVTPPRPLKPGDPATREPGTPLRRHPDEGRLRETCGDAIRGFYYIDCKPHDGVRLGLDDLKRAIAEAAEDLPGMNQPVARQWREARDQLRARGDAYMQIGQAFDETKKLQMKPAATRSCLRSADELGHLVYYGGETDAADDDLQAQEVVVLQPDQLAKAIGLVQTDTEDYLDQKGLVDVRHIYDLWQRGAADARVDKAFYPSFIALMNRYEVSYLVHQAGGGERRLLLAQQVPDLLPADLAEVWPADSTLLELRQECRVVDKTTGRPTPPMALMYRLIVRLHRFSLGRFDVEAARHWQRGVVLADGDNGRALLTLDPDGATLRLVVRAVHPQYLLWVLTREVVDVVESFWKSLRCDVYVPCLAPCELGERGPAWFNVAQLRRSKIRGIERVVCFHTSQTCPCDFRVDDLLLHAATASGGLTTAEILVLHTELMMQVRVMAADLRAVRNRQEWMHNDVRWGLRDMRKLMGDGFGELRHDIQTSVISVTTKLEEQTDHLLRSFDDVAAKGPRLFLLETLAVKGVERLRDLTTHRYRVTLVCEHSGLPVRLLNDPQGPFGVYDLEFDREWVQDAGEFIQWMGSTLQLGGPIAAALALQTGADAELYKKSAELLKASGDVMKDFGAELGKNAVNPKALPTDTNHLFSGGRRMLERLHAEMERQDEKANRPAFGGLKKVVYKTKGTFRWVHRGFEQEYR